MFFVEDDSSPLFEFSSTALENFLGRVNVANAHVRFVFHFAMHFMMRADR